MERWLRVYQSTILIHDEFSLPSLMLIFWQHLTWNSSVWEWEEWSSFRQILFLVYFLFQPLAHRMWVGRLAFFPPLTRNSCSSFIRVELKVSRRLVAKAPSPWHAECVKRSAQKMQRNFYDAEGYMIKSNLVLSYNFFFPLLFARSIIIQHEAVEITTPQVYTRREMVSLLARSGEKNYCQHRCLCSTAVGTCLKLGFYFNT